MRSVVGIFVSREDAERAFEGLENLGLTTDRLSLLSPGSPVTSVPTTEAEPPGIATALGGVVGAAAGLSGGGLLGAAAASLVFPGVGPVVAIGFTAAAAGVGGAVAGAAVGEELDRSLTTGLPQDELFFYEDALRKGRTVLVALADGDPELEEARQLLRREGAESLDEARKQWWIGLQDTPEYNVPEAGTPDESSYQLGFESALEPDARGKSYEEAFDHLKARHERLATEQAFRRGFEDGQQYYQKIVKILQR